jgi:hypothetical protein
MSCLSRSVLTFLTFVILGLGTDAVGQSVVVPNSLESVEGNDGVILINVARLQQVFAASQFSAFGGPRLITGMAFRPDIDQPPFTLTSPNVQISFSTTSRSPDGLSTTLSENVGADDTVVFSGSLTLSTTISGPPGGPNAFDMIINFTNPFLYDPAVGNLLFDIRSQSWAGFGFLDIENTPGDSVSSVLQISSGQTFTHNLGLVTQFSYSPAAQPSLTCPLAKIIKGCNLSGIGSLAYSEAPVMITVAQLQAEGGNVSAPCGIASITYQDSKSGACPTLMVSRTFTLTDVCGNSTSCQQTFNLGGGVIGNSEVVVPNSLAAVEGNSRNFIPFFTFTTCYQQVYNTSQFNFSGPRTITKIAFRPDLESDQRPFQITLSDVEIRLSTTTRSSDGLNFFCVNAGRNEKIVRRARELTLRSSASGPVDGPKNFDVVIRIASFRYDPAEGNLLLEIRNTGTISSGFQNTFLDASNVFGDPVSRVWQERGPFTSTKDTIGLVTKFFFAEPQ